MPELPEVETVSRGLKQQVLGETISEVEVLHAGVIVGAPEEFVRQLRNRLIAEISRKGKVLALKLEALEGGHPNYLMMRLGMTGQVTVQTGDHPLEPHTHVRLILGDGQEEIRFRDVRRFGKLRCCTREELEAVLAKLGPDAQQMTEAEFLRAARARRGAAKSWLMNQQDFCGLGNIYADESLFLARIHPLAQPGRLSPPALRRLYRAVKKVLDQAVALQGTSFRDYLDIEGRPGNFLPRLRVYQRTGEPCRRCGHAIRRIVVVGRSSHFCPRCQRRPRSIAGQPGRSSESPGKKASRISAIMT